MLMKLLCTEIENRDSYQVIHFSTESNDSNIQASGVIAIACGLDKSFEIDKYYGLDLEEVIL